jgi:hypothetical protein
MMAINVMQIMVALVLEAVKNLAKNGLKILFTISICRVISFVAQDLSG